MTPHGTDNYCCGGGSGFAIMSGHNFPDWRFHVAGRKKLEQVLHAFQDCLDPSIPKYLCAPCSNCKGQFRDMLAYYGLWENNRILYGGLVELIVNAMKAVKQDSSSGSGADAEECWRNGCRFELTIRLRGWRFSRPLPSTARPPFRLCVHCKPAGGTLSSGPAAEWRQNAASTSRLPAARRLPMRS